MATLRLQLSGKVFVVCGLWLVVLGLYFLLLRPALLPEDPRYIGSSIEAIRSAAPGLERWRGHVFNVMGGFMVATGAMTILVACRLLARRERGTFAALLVAVSLQLRDGLLQEFIGQVVQPLGSCQPHSGAQDAPGLPGQTFGRLSQDLQSGVGQQVVLAARSLEGVGNEQGKALSLQHRFELQMHLDTTVQCRVRGTLQGLCQHGMPHQRQRHQVTRIKCEVQKRREIPKEFRWQVLRFIDDPQRGEPLAVDPLMDTLLDVAPQWRTSIVGLHTKRARQSTINVNAPEVGVALVQHLVAVRVEGCGSDCAARRSCPRRAHP